MPERVVVSNFISTYATVILTLRSRRMPSLARSSTQHMQEAHTHPNTVISQAMGAIALVQKALNVAKDKANKLMEQHSILEHGFAALLQLGDQAQDTTGRQLIPTDSEEKLKKMLTELNQIKEKIQTSMEELQKYLPIIDKKTEKNSAIWLQHQEKQFIELAKQLEKLGIILTTEEKAELHRGISTTSSIKEKIENLQKLGIKIPNKSSDFLIATYDVIVATLSRTLQKIDDSSVKNIIKKLPVVSAAEDESSKLIKECKESFYETKQAAAKHEKAIVATAGLSSSQLETVEQLIKTISALPKPTAEPANAPPN